MFRPHFVSAFPQAKLLEMQALRDREEEAKESALERVAELEMSLAELEKLRDVVAEFALQLDAATGRTRRQRDEMREQELHVKEIRQLVDGLEARNSVLAAAAAASEDLRTELQVGLCTRVDGIPRRGMAESWPDANVPQANLAQAEAERCRQTADKEAALLRAAELGALNAELQAEIAELVEKLAAVSISQQAKEDEVQDLRGKLDGMEASNAALVASGAAAEAQQAALQVGGDP